MSQKPVPDYQFLVPCYIGLGPVGIAWEWNKTKKLRFLKSCYASKYSVKGLDLVLRYNIQLTEVFVCITAYWSWIAVIIATAPWHYYWNRKLRTHTITITSWWGFQSSSVPNTHLLYISYAIDCPHSTRSHSQVRVSHKQPQNGTVLDETA